MNVLHVIPAVAARYGGPSRVIVEMGRALLAAGESVLVATTDADGPGRLAVVQGERTLYQGVPMQFFPRQLSEAFKYSGPMGQWLARQVANFEVVHIHAVFNHASLAAARACRQRGVPYVVRPLGTLAPWSLQQKRWQKRLLWQLGVKQMLQGAAAIHYTAEGERRETEQGLGLANGVVIPLGVAGDELKGNGGFGSDLVKLEGRPYVLVLSRLHPKKNLRALVNSFLEVTGQGGWDEWRLVVAGEGEAGYVAGLKQLVAERGGQDRVLFPGWLSGGRKAAALRGAALLALPSYQENFGLAAVEAMACGVPVLVSQQVNLAPEIAAAGAGWVVLLAEGALKQALGAVFRDEQERAVRGAAGKALVEARFTWPTVAADLIRLYQRIIS